MRSKTTALLGTLVLGLCLGAPARATTIGWATQGSGAPNVAVALGEPGADAVSASLGSPLTFSGFTDAISYSQLIPILVASGVSNSAIAAMDFIAFDLNGSTGGFEGSAWTFDDGQGGTHSVSHNFGSLGSGIVFNGDISDANYAALFGASSPFGFIGLILFDLTSQGVDVSAPSLTVTLEGISTSGVDEPDPSGLGVIVPEPGTALLLGFGLSVLGCGRRRRTEGS